MLASLSPPAHAHTLLDERPIRDAQETIVRELARRQLEELDIPQSFLPFLREDAKVQTGRWLWGEPAPDLNRDSAPEVLETDLRYRYSVDMGPGQVLPTVDSETRTTITVRAGRTGRELWHKRYPRDAWPMAMRVGPKAESGVVVISGLWNFYGTTEENTITLDAFTGKNGKRLWTREYTSVSYYDMLTQVTEDSPFLIARLDSLKGRASDLMIAFATQVSTWVSTTMATRVVMIDGATGAEHVHPVVDVGVDWWPIPLPANDLDGDGLDDYATTNNFGVDTGGNQEPPTFGGTLYARKGTDGSEIWTTSGIEMKLFAFTSALPDAVADGTPDLGLSTYVERKAPGLLPVPIYIPFVSGVSYRPRVYLFDGKFGAEAWHKHWEWIYSPGDIDRTGKADIMLGKFRAKFRKSKTTFHQLAVNGVGERIWQRRSVWKFETIDCPRGLCIGGYWFMLDVTPDVEPDSINDVLMAQHVEQNRAFEDSITRLFNGDDGVMRFETEDEMQSAGIAIDGKGTDLIAYKHKDNKVRVSARNGMNKTLWAGMLGGPDKILPRNSWFWAQGLKLPGDRCGDLVLTGFEDQESFYAVLDGRDGHLIWWRWTGPKADRPTFDPKVDRNRGC